MAVAASLSPGARRRLLALAAAVVAAHVVALHWFSRWQADLSLLRPMVAPLYTRLLQPEAPPPPPPAPAAVAEAPPARPVARVEAAPSVPREVTQTVAAPEPAPPPPVVEPVAPPPVAAAPQPAASQPVAAASTAGAGNSADALASWPADTRLRYNLGGRFRSGDLYGDAKVLWQRDGAKYQARVEVGVTLFASLVMTSQGEVGPNALVPSVYEEVRSNRTRGLRMGENEVTLANGRVVRRPPGVQDTASQFVELSHRFASGREKLEVGRSVSLWMARPGQVDLWTYDIVAKDMLKTKLGEIEAFHLKPRPIANPRGNITAEMWFAPALQYLPVRIVVKMGEEAEVDLLVEAIEQR